MSLTYSNYLKIEELLRLQQVPPDAPEHDETLFIIIHQVYELWFKLLLHEFDRVKIQLSGNDMYGAIATFKRARTVMKTLVSQLDILETMTPMSFSNFRARLASASGFQSAQFRELEFVLGYKRREMLELHEPNSPAYARIEQRFNERSVVDHFYDFLETNGVSIPAEIEEKDVTAATIANETLQRGIERLYRTDDRVAMLFELMTDFDEGFQEWRYRHVMMVERTIGTKPGTGGSPGAAFLRSTLFNPVFPDLWAVRSNL